MEEYICWDTSPAVPVEQPIIRTGRVRRRSDRHQPGTCSAGVRGKECGSVEYARAYCVT